MPSQVELDLEVSPWIKQYLKFLIGTRPYPHLYINSFRLHEWEALDLTEKGSRTSRSDEQIVAIKRHAVLWHRPNEQCFTRHSDLGMTIEHCNTRLHSVQDIVSQLIRAEVEKSDTILGVTIDAVVTLDYVILKDKEPLYSITARMCPGAWAPRWITDQNLLRRLHQRRIPVQSRQIRRDGDRYDI